MTGLAVAPTLTLPVSAATETLGILAVKRAGKSNAAVVLAEEMHAAGVPWVAIDPKGDWWGIRAAGDGKHPGLDVVVFGGLHGDVPLEPASGNLVADLIASTRLTAVLDVSEMTRADQRRFLTDFATRLYRKNRDPLHVFCEEADEYIPQRVMGENAKMVGAFETLVKRGGFRGIGVTLITQRSASLNKDVLTQVGTLVAMRTPSPQDRKAILGWVSYHDTAASLVDELPTLSAGEAIVFSPEWLPREGLDDLYRIRFRRRSTFDSGSTPEVGAKARAVPVRLADVDLDAIKQQMADAIERAEAEDPKVLRQRIAGLERDLAKARRDLVENPRVTEKLVEVAWIPPALSELAHAFRSRTQGLVTNYEALLKLIDQFDVEAVAVEAARTVPVRSGDLTPRAARRTQILPGPDLRPAPAAMKASNGVPPTIDGPKLKAGARRMLEQLAQFPGGLKPGILSARAKVKRSGGSWSTYLSTLRTNGYVEESNGLVRITDTGLAAAGGARPPMSGADLLDDWRGRLKAGARRMLDVLVDAYPEAVSSDELAAKAEIERSGGSWSTYLSLLRSNDLMVEPERGWHLAADAFFDQLAD